MKATQERRCVLHPDRVVHANVTGIPVCDECLDLYRTELRSGAQGFCNRPFFQSLVRARHGLEATVCQT